MVLTHAFVGVEEYEFLDQFYNTWTKLLICSCLWLLLTLLYTISSKTMAKIYLSAVDIFYSGARVVVGSLVICLAFLQEDGWSVLNCISIGFFEIVLVGLQAASTYHYQKGYK